MLQYAIYLVVCTYVHNRHSNMRKFNIAANVKGTSKFSIHTSHRKDTHSYNLDVVADKS